ncbi:MAG TPA: NAD(P)-dependent oxidoreductase [Desulfatiglandales bacterium]|nr:NAD(P)-dependent oxidoreductase [Desulfatiglandales bacterium]HUX80078.1 NAD(P)-dependent oxidoreductase [Alphaproteobacteria bacterium]
MLGFVGTGMMGAPMAENLLKAGFEIMVYDIRPEATKNAVALGAKSARNPSDMAFCDVVFVIVNTFEQVKDVVLGENGIVQGFRGEEPLRLVVMSTVSPNLIKNLANKIETKKITIIDAPVSGGPVKAQEGLLSFMVGGEKDVVASIKPYLQTMGNNILHIGPLGSGLATKLVNNIVTLTTLYVIPEALRLGLKGGLDIRTMVEVMRVSTANNWHFDHWSSYVGFLGMLLGDPKAHESLNLIAIKDIQTALAWAEELGYEACVLKAILSLIESGVNSNGLITEELFDQMINANISDKQ